jgi:hypothetical protein
MVPRRDRIDVWWNLATVPWRDKTRNNNYFSLDRTDNLIDAPADCETSFYFTAFLEASAAGLGEPMYRNGP